ncbi:hypothetical protein E2562_017386 [Oryza meyeriana var. granulata]|uniref:Uncharacterized protein n=1 Tax=Oryza meyeriana var. granulata TaxID=110450 RepID=A0A6G1D6P5_9ORYZ|nr:hypothetical protein E2562_017386 [Oryza meyeriana var. granulata]
MAEEEAKPSPLAGAVIVAMKGHPGSGKSTVARAIAAALRCPLLDKDDIRDCTLHLERVDGRAVGMLNELSYAVLWRVAERQVELGLSIVVDSPLSHRAHLDALTCLPAALVVVVECRPGDEEEWRRRLEERGAAVAEGGGNGWHKPKTWAELERLRDGYQGCTDYEFGDVPRIVVDTTDPTVDSEAIAIRMAPSVLQPGVPVTLQELEPSSEMFRQGASLRVTGILQSYDLNSAIAVIQDGGTSLKVDTQHLRDISFRTNSTYQFIGELLIKPDNDVYHSPPQKPISLFDLTLEVADRDRVS